MSEKKIYNVPQYLELGITPTTPDLGFWKIYPKLGTWYILNDGGIESTLGLSPNTSDYVPVSNGVSFIDSPIFIDSSNVGIGTITPSSTLQVGATSGSATFNMNGGSGLGSTFSVVQHTAVGYGIDFYNPNFSRGYIIGQQTGNVGGGTTAKTAIMFVSGTGSALECWDVDGKLRTIVSTGYQGDDAFITSRGDIAGLGTDGFMQWTNTTSYLRFDSGKNLGYANPYLIMVTAGGASGAVKIASYGDSYFNGGNVSIGTATPTQRLHVIGAPGLGALFQLNDSVFEVQSSGGVGQIRLSYGLNTFTVNPYPLSLTTPFSFISNTGGVSGESGIQHISTATIAGPGGVLYGQELSINSGGIFAGSITGLIIKKGLTYSNPNAVFYPLIALDGNVGIGTSTPALTLDVTGNVNSTTGYWFNGNRILQSDSVNLTNIFLGYYNFNGVPGNTGSGVYGIGFGAAGSNSGDNAILIGADAGYTNSGSYVVGLGWQSLQANTGSSVFAIGLQAAFNNTGSNVLVIGNYAAKDNTISNAAFIGTSATGGGVGYLDIYIGTGVNRTNESIHYVNLRQGTAKVGEVDKSMANAPFNIIGAVGTGTGIGGDIVLKVAPAGLTGSTQNALIEAMRVTMIGANSKSTFNGTVDIIGFSNTLFIGNGAGNLIGALTNDHNIGIGRNSLINLDGGYQSVAIGSNSFEAQIAGGGNTGVGYRVGAATTGSANALVGYSSMSLSTTGSGNSYLGANTGTDGNGSYNVFLGYYAGKYETGSNKLIIDNINRVTEALSRTGALIYGISDPTIANQILAINANVGIGNITPNASAALDITSTTKGLLLPRMTAAQAGLITGVDGLMIYVTDTDLIFSVVGFYGYENGAWIKL